jgi:ferrous iron transport protein B
VAVKGEGISELLSACVSAASGGSGLSYQMDYGHGAEEVVRELTVDLERNSSIPGKYIRRWLAIKLLESDPEVEKSLSLEVPDVEELLKAARSGSARIAAHFREDAFTVIPERRYGFASGVVKQCVTRTGEARRDVTDRIDSVLCHKFLGPLILVGVVYALFIAVFKLADEWPWMLGRSPTGWVEWMFGKLTELVEPLSASAPLVHSLIADAMIGGVGGVMSFVPLIAILFLFIAFLEDSGYIARVAFIMDRLLRAFGLQGKSILALIVAGGLGGGGCAVPGIMATRTLREEKDRLVTILVVPFMNCGAKMPLYIMLIAAFYASQRAEMLLLLWAISWTFTLVLAFLLRRFIIKGTQTPFVMELPAYHLPTIKGLFLHSWERTWLYIKKAGTIILAVNLVLWALMSFPRLSPSENEDFDERIERASASMEEALESRNVGAEKWTSFLLEAETRSEISSMAAQVAELRKQESGEDRTRAMEALRKDRERVFLIARLSTDLEKIETLHQRQAELERALSADPGSTEVREALAAVVQTREGLLKSLAEADPEAIRGAREFRTFTEEERSVENDRAGRQLRGSVAGILGRCLSHVSHFAGFDWRDNIALIGGFAAKEVVVGTLGTAYAMGDVDPDAATTLSDRLAVDPSWSPLRALAMMIFVMVYAPCLATLAVIRRETNSWKWPLFALTYTTAVALVAAIGVFQIGSLLA